MKIESLQEHGIPETFIEKFKEQGIEKLYDPQKKSLKKGLLDFKNQVVAAPTASGKTFIATLAAIKKLVEERSKVIYLVPLIALAGEKWNYYKKLLKKSGFRVAISTGDFDSTSDWLANYDFIIMTTEKCDSLMRHGARWINEVGLIIVDEVHLLNDPSRGPTLEVTLTRLRETVSNAQLLCLSATISNVDEISEWLNAESIKSDFRPVELHEGIYYDNKIQFFGRDDYDIEEKISAEKAILGNTVKLRKQALYFLSTRRNTESLARRLGNFNKKFLKKNEKKELKILSDELLNVLEKPTRQCKKLADYAKNGVVFHHAGLLGKQKSLIEDNFRKGLIRSICATPTLCLSGDSKVWSGMKDIEIKNLKGIDPILTLSGNSLISSQPEKVNRMENLLGLLKLETTSGHNLILTPNHKILVKRNLKKKIIEVRNCKKSDRVATVGKLRIENEKKPRFSDFVKINKLPFKDRYIGKDIFYLIGAMLGDGYSGAEISNENKIIYKGSPQLVGEETEIFDRVIETCEKYGIYYRVSKNSYGTPILTLTKCNWFREFLVNCGVDLGKNKFINFKLMSAEKDELSSLLRGIFDTDGFVEELLRLGMSSVSKKMVKNIQRTLLRFGIVSSIKKRKSGKIKVYNKEYNTKKSYELLIMQKKSIKNFHQEIGFGVTRKQKSLLRLVEKIDSNIHYFFCKNCKYKLYRDLFSGRTKSQKKWGKQKLKLIETLGKKGELKSRALFKKLGFEPKKKGLRLNHHYELISKRKFSSNEWIWFLNDIGEWLYNNYIKRNKNYESLFKNHKNCPLCGEKFHVKIRGDWRDSDFDNDIFWDRIRKISPLNRHGVNYVYDLVLPSNGDHDNLFVANGIIVHNSMGVNLPAFRVIVRDIKRYYAGYGMRYIPVLEYKQFVGRAGRPDYDEFGESILVAKSETDAHRLTETYIFGEPEDVYSKLSLEPVLRMHTLALIASGFICSREELMKFFGKTFYAYQYGEMTDIEMKLDKILEILFDFKFLQEKGDKIVPTKIGKRVSELYLDPITAYHFVKSLRKSNESTPIFSFIHLMSNTLEMRPLLRIRKKDYDEINDKIAKSVFLEKVPEDWDIDYDKFMRSVKTAMLFESWIEEVTEDKLLSKYRVAPGDMYYKLKNADWLFYSLNEIGLLLGKKKVLGKIRKLRVRTKYGVRKELLPLVRLKKIGRVRARILFDHNLKSVSDLRNVPLSSLSRIIGPKIANSIKKQLGEDHKEIKDEKQMTLG